MKNYYLHDEWLIIEEGFNPDLNRESESIFSIGNGYMGQRANFEEQYTGDSLQGSYVAGIYYPDRTRVGWWKVGYPEYFAKVPNAPRWTGIDVKLDKKPLDLFVNPPVRFRRILNMKEGLLERNFITGTGNGTVEVTARRFVSMALPWAGVIKYSVKPVDFTGEAEFSLYLDSDVQNEDTNYGEKFWEEISHGVGEGWGVIVSSTQKTGFHVALGMMYSVEVNGIPVNCKPTLSERADYVSNNFRITLNPGDECTIYKYVSVLSSLNVPREKLRETAIERAAQLKEAGYDSLFAAHRAEWDRIWASSDVVIEGDVVAWQAIRFNIFQLNQTYTGHDPRLNIGPKGFTGEKYGGSTYWDTEAFCLPFFLKTSGTEVPRNLLLYRYRHLEKAIENASRLGFGNGAALFPMVTINGEECHNEWEITFEEIHRNGAIAFAVYNYVRHTGDGDYIVDFGLEVLVAISRFWSQRITWSEHSQQYVMLGVTGPNEYENNVNNNWYTNILARWTIRYTVECAAMVKEKHPVKFSELAERTGFSFNETVSWIEKADKLRLPFDENLKVFIQQDGFLDKELKPASSIPPDQRPINQNWSWDRILRSCFIKQADVLQGLYLFEDEFDIETIARNFDFYEPMTVHESSLSACIHSILASRLGNISKAYDLYLRTARLDLDDYNHEVAEGLHVTSMAGTWLAIVEGFAGMRIHDGKVLLRPLIPSQWKSYSFHARFRGNLFEVKVTPRKTTVRNLSGNTLSFIFNGDMHEVDDQIVFDNKGI